MKHAQFLQRIDDARILAAIANVEAKTTGAVRVLVSKRRCRDPLASAGRHFRVLGLHQRPEHNAVLIFLAPRSHTFALYGDSGIHQRVGNDAWIALRNQTGEFLKDSRFTDALVHAIDRAGELLIRFFPRESVSGRE
jgi:uncharacterized membrane protein